MQSKLTPVTVVDKNGRTTVVHKNLSKGGSTNTGTELPAPSHATAVKSEQVPAKARRFDTALREARRKWNADEVALLDAELQSEDIEYAKVVAEYAQKHYDFVDVHEFIALAPKLGLENWSVAGVLVRSMCQYKDVAGVVTVWNRAVASEEVQRQAVAVLKVAALFDTEKLRDGLSESDFNLHEKHAEGIMFPPFSDGDYRQQREVTLREDELASYVASEAENVDAIIDVIRTHKVSDYRTIRALVEGTTPSLVSGAL